ncbi:MAG: hypothetical protein V7752_14225 [Halopseudomonas sp.]
MDLFVMGEVRAWAIGLKSTAGSQYLAVDPIGQNNPRGYRLCSLGWHRCVSIAVM